ncbi:probable polygalacturonase isoform X2 [Triticum aestivum]|uniref:probable polygalacturonase isoform X2 n=1 Tax=Triticum aestivum TaxID=4565 RepID=UPI001D020A32|nr:probable polygalacturonase isoform X2 [Triticum aestivum]
MKRLVVLSWVLAVVLGSVHGHVRRQWGEQVPPESRPHSVTITEFGAVGDGRTLNTLPFQNAVFYARSFADKGGAQLYVPKGRWLTGSFNLTSHLTLFLEKDAIIVGTEVMDLSGKRQCSSIVLFVGTLDGRGNSMQIPDQQGSSWLESSQWPIVEPLPSYGQGLDLPGPRHCSLINGYNLTDVVITGNNGLIDGQGLVWWDWLRSHELNHSRPHLVEFLYSEEIVISNLTFLNSPAWSIHPVYCSNVKVHNVTIKTLLDAPLTDGIVPDSCLNVCIEDSTISVSHEAISVKSGLDKYGISIGRPTSDIHISRVDLQASSGAALAFGSEMSGGISGIHADHLRIHGSDKGFSLKTTPGRGGYIKEVIISDVEMDGIRVAIEFIGNLSSHPDDDFDPSELPVIDQITLKNMVGTNISVAGILLGIDSDPFTAICLSNLSFSITDSLHSSPWSCSNVSGYSESVLPEPCSELYAPSSNSSICFSLPSYSALDVA